MFVKSEAAREKMFKYEFELEDTDKNANICSSNKTSCCFTPKQLQKIFFISPV